MRVGYKRAGSCSGKKSARIRVTKTEEQSRTIITIDGRLSGDSIAVAEACCNQAKSNGKPIELFLRDITTVDQAGQMLLSRLAAKGVRMVARGLYTSYLVQSLASDKAVPDHPAVKITAGSAEGEVEKT